jgi:hypothetical protein
MKLISRLIQEIRNIGYELQARTGTVKPAVAVEVPYVCQFAKPEHAELSLKKELAPVDDPHWRKTGAISAERYAQWALTMCGMASAAMALSHFKGNSAGPAELAEDAMRHGVYVDEQGIISSMRYREFIPWIGKYGVEAQMYSRLTLKGVQYALSGGKLVIASVNPNIRGFDTAPRFQKGGHLVLVTGYDRLKKTITINNPSGFTSAKTQINHILKEKEFLAYYAGRGILLSAAA